MAEQFGLNMNYDFSGLELTSQFFDQYCIEWCGYLLSCYITVADHGNQISQQLFGNDCLLALYITDLLARLYYNSLHPEQKYCLWHIKRLSY